MGLPEYLAAAVVVLTVLALFGRLGWPFELFTHFRPHYALLGVVAAVWSFTAGDQAVGFVAAYCALSNGVMSRGWATAAPQPGLAASPGLTVVWANVWKKREALERTLAWARDNGADLVMIGEMPPIDSGEPASAAHFPHVADTGRNEGAVWTSRIAVYSRAALGGVEVSQSPGRHSRPYLRFSTDVGGARLNMIAVQPAAPMTASMLRDRNALITRLRDTARAPFLIAGDFNATPWSPIYPRIPGARIGRALLAPTWLTGLPLLGLPIDHIKVSPEVRASLYKVAPFLGSDHRAVLARVHLPGGQAQPPAGAGRGPPQG